MPRTLRRPIVFVVGSLFVLAAVLTGWLPGPGGIPLFLIGIAILATEFEMAARFRDTILRNMKRFGEWFKRHLLLAICLCLLAGGVALFIGFFIYNKLN